MKDSTQKFGNLAHFLRVHEKWGIATALLERNADKSRFFEVGDYLNYKNKLLELCGKEKRGGVGLIIEYDSLVRQEWQRRFSGKDPTLDLRQEMSSVNQEFKTRAQEKVAALQSSTSNDAPKPRATARSPIPPSQRRTGGAGPGASGIPCTVWIRSGDCERGKNCRFVHNDREQGKLGKRGRSRSRSPISPARQRDQKDDRRDRKRSR